MKDLVSILAKCRAVNLSEQQTKKLVSIAVYDELKQMLEEEFEACFASASIDTETMEFVITLKFKITLDVALSE